jgi:hypothetical protein
MPYIAQDLRRVEIVAGGANGLHELVVHIDACVGEGLFERHRVVSGAAAALINRAVDRPGRLHFPLDGVVGMLRDTPAGREVECAAVTLGAAAAGVAAESGGGLEGLLNYLLTRLFNEVYRAPRYRDFNEIVGILESLIARCPGDDIAILGVLRCCQLEYYRKYAAPYEDVKEAENGPVARGG